jgi:transposase
MMGYKERVFVPLTNVSLDELVPADQFYRRLDRALDLSFVRELVAPFYSASGRPSIDPVVFFRLQLIMFFEGIRSERQLMQTVHLNLAHRWYLGYDLHEPVPDHSSLTKIRDRFGLATFQRFFEHVVDLCVQAGLVWGRELYFDGTRVAANANVDTLVPRFYVEAKQHLQVLFPEPAADECNEASPADAVAQSEPERAPSLSVLLPGGAGPGRAVSSDRGVSESDAQAAIVARTPLWGSQVVAWAAALPPPQPGEGEYRGRADCRRTEPQATLAGPWLGPPTAAGRGSHPGRRTPSSHATRRVRPRPRSGRARPAEPLSINQPLSQGCLTAISAVLQHPGFSLQ